MFIRGRGWREGQQLCVATSLKLPSVMGLISKGEYGLAVEFMRRQKVDLNLLVDMNPDIFLIPAGDVGKGKCGGKGGGGARYYDRVVDQVREIEWLNLRRRDI